MNLLRISLAVCVTVAALAGSALARENLRIVGSTTVEPFASKVGQQFAEHGNFEAPNVTSTGTGAGLKAFCKGVGAQHPDIAMASRPIRDDELAACQANGVAGIAEIKFGHDAIALAYVAAESGQPWSLSRTHIWQALAEQVPVRGSLAPNPYRQWSEIDPSLLDDPIAFYGPGQGHGTLDTFIELFLRDACNAAPEIAALEQDARDNMCRQLRSDGVWAEFSGDAHDILDSLEGADDIVGVVPYSAVLRNRGHHENELKMVHIDGVAPTIETIGDGSYPGARELFIYVKTAHLDEVPGLRDYVVEFVSDAAIGEAGYLLDLGLIPLSEDERRQSRQAAEPLHATN